MEEKTFLDHQLDQLRASGVKVHTGKRAYQGTMMSQDNVMVFTDWIATWARNAAQNFPVISRARGVTLLLQAGHDLPVVIAGIGPSLDDNLATLRRVRSNILLVATDAALRPLVAAGIHPDLVLNYDCRPEQCSMWDTVDTSRFVLVANSCTAPETINAWKGRFLFFNMSQSDDPFCLNVLPAMFPHLGDLACLGTVGNSAVLLAAAMRASKIITVGMDLCYRKYKTVGDPVAGSPGHHHAVDAYSYRCKDFRWLPASAEFADGRWEETENKILYDNDTRVKGLKESVHGGQTFMVDAALDSYAKSLVAAVTNFNLPLVDCSGGVLGRYFPSMSLQDAVEKYAFDRIYAGRSIVRHLFPLLNDPKAGLTWNGERWADECPA